MIVIPLLVWLAASQTVMPQSATTKSLTTTILTTRTGSTQTTSTKSTIKSTPTTPQTTKTAAKLTEAPVNYCDESLCPKGTKHIACGHSGAFASSCPNDRTIVNLTAFDMNLFLDKHNILRNKIAGGQQSGFLPAVRMASMVSSYSID